MPLATFRLFSSATILALALVACSQQNNADHATPPSLKAAVGDRFTIGAAASAPQIATPDSQAVRILTTHFNSIVAENCMKCEVIHPFEATYNFAGGDSIVTFAQENNMEMIGHCLLWHSQMAPWFCVDSLGNNVSPDVLRQRIKSHIHTIVGRYKGKVHGWDVCNEIIVEDGSFRKSPLFEILGTEFVYDALQFAHEADPDAELYLNDYGMTAPGRRDAYLALIDSIKARGLRLDAIGMQGHMGMDYPQVEEFEQSMLAFAAKGVGVMVTEWDMSILPTVTQSANISDVAEARKEFDPYWPNAVPDSVARAWNDRMGAFWALFVKHSDIMKRVTAWGVTDAASWKNDFPVPGRHDEPLLFDRQGQPKPFIKEFINKECNK